MLNDGERTHKIGKQKKKGSPRDNCIAWKTPGTLATRRALCCSLVIAVRVFWEMPMSVSNADYVVTHKKEKTIDQNLLLALVLECVPNLRTRAFNKNGELCKVTASKLRGRFDNFSHDYTPDTYPDGTPYKGKRIPGKKWSINDTEYPYTHPELRKSMRWAIRCVDNVLQTTKLLD